MRRTIFFSALLSLAAAGGASAQAGGPAGPPPPPPPPPGDHRGPPSTADFLLGHTGELQLTDAQVTRLAAIARRTHQQREAARAEMQRDTAHRAPGRSAGPPPPERERFRAQELAERRDALAVLTPDQQAEAWDLVQHGRGGPGGPGGPGGRGGPGGPGRGGPEGGRGPGGDRPGSR